jgi:putative NADPH-quinone reductase
MGNNLYTKTKHMKNILIVSAHPSGEGRTQRIVETYASASEKAGHSVTVLDLYAPENMLPFLAFTNVREWPQSPQQDRMKQLLTEADELVFVHPIWWGTVPAILKNWIDTVFEAGLAFRYNKQGKVEKLLTGKTAKVFAICGAPSFIYWLPILPFRSFWKTAVLGFCGVKVTDIQILGSADMGSPEDRTRGIETFLEKIRQSASR